MLANIVGEHSAEFMRFKQVLAAIDLPRSTAYDLISQGKFPIPEVLPRLGRNRRYRRADVQRYTENRWHDSKRGKVA
jgi:predicted DNA-binding transcriptional regulator AlpA